MMERPDMVYILYTAALMALICIFGSVPTMRCPEVYLHAYHYLYPAIIVNKLPRRVYGKDKVFGIMVAVGPAYSALRWIISMFRSCRLL